MKRKILNNMLTIVFIIALFFFIITFSIGLPIYFRPFYYLQIKTLNIEAESGFTYAQIKSAYDEVLNYLTIGTQFGTGELSYTQSGYEHFRDCKVLFDLNLSVLIISFVISLTIILLNHFKVIEIKHYYKFPPYFYVSIITLIIPLVLVILASLDFDRAFTIFHHIFFPGKDNWLFDYDLDQIIRVLPEDFFMNCGILIASSVIAISLTLLIISIIKRKKVVTLGK